MKKVIIILSVIAFIMVSCGGNRNSESIGVVEASKNDDLYTNVVNKDTLSTDISNKEIIKYKFVKPAKVNGNETVYSNYSIIDLGDGEPCSIKLNNKVYKTNNAVLDYGELQLLLYENDKNNVAFIGLIDYYGSVFFVYYISNGVLYELGIINSDQPDVENVGFKETTFDVYKEENEIKIIVYLGKKQTQILYFKI